MEQLGEDGQLDFTYKCTCLRCRYIPTLNSLSWNYKVIAQGYVHVSATQGWSEYFIVKEREHHSIKNTFPQKRAQWVFVYEFLNEWVNELLWNALGCCEGGTRYLSVVHLPFMFTAPHSTHTVRPVRHSIRIKLRKCNSLRRLNWGTAG